MTQRIFMPGCSLPSYSPKAVDLIAGHLKRVYPDMGAVQKCCGKPTAALGQEQLFTQRYAQLQANFDHLLVDEVIVACQNCYKMIMQHSPQQTPVSLWTLLPKIGLPQSLIGKAKGSDVVFSVHDSCATRDERELQDGVRWILNELGYRNVDPEHAYANTRCCGQGGMVAAANPQLGQRVAQRLVDDLPTDHVVVYCAACRAAMMGVNAKAWHILDLLFGPVVMLGDTPPANVLANPLKSWGNRYISKRNLIKCVSI